MDFMGSDWSRSPELIPDILEKKKETGKIEIMENDRQKPVIFLKLYMINNSFAIFLINLFTKISVYEQKSSVSVFYNSFDHSCLCTRE